MSMQPRWLRSAIAASAGPVPALPWQRSAVFMPIVPENCPPPPIARIPRPAPPLRAAG